MAEHGRAGRLRIARPASVMAAEGSGRPRERRALIKAAGAGLFGGNDVGEWVRTCGPGLLGDQAASTTARLRPERGPQGDLRPPARAPARVGLQRSGPVLGGRFWTADAGSPDQPLTAPNKMGLKFQRGGNLLGLDSFAHRA